MLFRSRHEDNDARDDEERLGGFFMASDTLLGHDILDLLLLGLNRLQSDPGTEAERGGKRHRNRPSRHGIGPAPDCPEGDACGDWEEEHEVAWGLTPTERDVAMLILKSERHKRIAGLTSRSERTVRQHAVTIYDKSGLRDRAELAAFFLQDLVVPPSPDD